MVTIENGEEGGASGSTLLDALNNARVFNVYKLEDGRFCFEESCEKYFYVNLTRDQVHQLADELTALAGAHR
jgi:hypothetical protein